MSSEIFLERVEQPRGDLYDGFAFSATPYEKEAELWYMHHSDGGITEILHTKASEPCSKYTLLLVPGFITILDSWEVFLQGVKSYFDIFYWESREKGTFHPPQGKLRRELFSVNRFKTDLVEVMQSIDIPENRVILAGSSFGGTLIIDVTSEGLVNPHSAILIGANIHFHIPFPGNILSRIVPASLITLFKPLIRWYLRNFEVDRITDETQYQKYVKAVELANFKFIKHTVLNYHQHPQEEILEGIQCPTIVVGAELDKMHTIDESQFTTGQIPNAELAAFKTNRETHSEPFVKYFMQRFCS